jgi:hypothetical protein
MSIPPTRNRAEVPLLGKAEKGQLEELILQKLQAHYDTNGPGALLVDSTRVVVHGRGVDIDHGEHPDPLAAVQVKTLFTALCYLSAGSPAMPRDALDSLATEATSVAAAHINRIAPE